MKDIRKHIKVLLYWVTVLSILLYNIKTDIYGIRQKEAKVLKLFNLHKIPQVPGETDVET